MRSENAAEGFPSRRFLCTMATMYKNALLRLPPACWLFGAFLLALAVRLLFVSQWQATPYGSWPLLDAAAYNDWAKLIAQGEWGRPRAFYQSPLYPYLLGFVYFFLGPQTLWAGWLGALLDAGTVALLSAFSLKHFGRRAALATALLATFFRPMIFYSAPVMKEPLALFLIALLLPFAWQAVNDNKRKAYALCGLIIGLGALARGNELLFAPALILFALLKHRRAAVKNSLTLAIATMLALAPATLHNWLANDDFVLMNYADGFNLYIGHSPIANGTNAYPPEVSTDPVQEEFNVSYLASQALGHEAKPSEVSHYWRSRALDEIAANPGREFFLLLNKIIAFWNGEDTFDNYDPPFIAANFGTVVSGPLVSFWMLSTLAGFALFPLVRRKNGAALLLAFMGCIYFASVMPFYVTDRYRLPIVIFLLPLAGAALPAAAQLWREKDKKGWVLSLACALFFAALGLMPNPTKTDLTAYDWGTLTTVYANLEQNEQALDALEKGIAVDPARVGPQAFIQAASAARKIGLPERSEKLLDDALAVYPNDGIVHYNVGRQLATEGKLPEALKSFERAIELNPSYVLNYYALALINDRLGAYDKASAFAAQGLAIDPNNKYLWDFVAHRQGVQK